MQFVDVADGQAPSPPNLLTYATEIEIEHFPLTSAGAPIMNGTDQQAYYETYHARMGDANGTYAPFCSKMDWEIAQWVKTHGSSASAVNELLAIDRVSLIYSCLHYYDL